jgi:O-antigen/teichoic acid export membrane protein
MLNLTRTQKLSVWASLFAAVYFITLITPDLNAAGTITATISWFGMVGFACWAGYIHARPVR